MEVLEKKVEIIDLGESVFDPQKESLTGEQLFQGIVWSSRGLDMDDRPYKLSFKIERGSEGKGNKLIAESYSKISDKEFERPLRIQVGNLAEELMEYLKETFSVGRNRASINYSGIRVGMEVVRYGNNYDITFID